MSARGVCACWALFVATLLGCNPPNVEVLLPVKPKVPVYTRCEDVFAEAQEGDACRGLSAGCTRARECASDTAYCENGVLYFVREDLCPACEDDTFCADGSLCVAGRCRSCSTPVCPPCEENLVPLYRHGCETCECGPPSQCQAGECSEPEECIQGTICVEGCDRLDCCANVCTLPACNTPAPLGCEVLCEGECDGYCVADSCSCDPEGTWSCSAYCSQVQPPCGFV